MHQPFFDPNAAVSCEDNRLIGVSFIFCHDGTCLGAGGRDALEVRFVGVDAGRCHIWHLADLLQKAPRTRPGFVIPVRVKDVAEKHARRDL